MYSHTQQLAVHYAGQLFFSGGLKERKRAGVVNTDELKAVGVGPRLRRYIFKRAAAGALYGPSKTHRYQSRPLVRKSMRHTLWLAERAEMTLVCASVSR